MDVVKVRRARQAVMFIQTCPNSLQVALGDIVCAPL